MAAQEDAPVRSTAEVEIDAPPQAVWDVLTDFQSWPHWNPDVKSMSFAGPLAPGSEFRWKAGAGDDRLYARADRAPALHRLARPDAHDRRLPGGGSSRATAARM